jgi:DNA polymerase-3 subunit epsilon
MYLVFDTETSGGFPQRGVADNAQKCSIVQLAFLVADKDFNIVTSQNFLIQQDSPICESSQAIHKKTDDMCKKYGVKPRFAFNNFFSWCGRADYIIAHNINFDISMVNIMCSKINLEVGYPLNKICTMELTRDLLKIPPTEKMLKAGFTQYKSPSLKEAYKHAFGKDFDNAHDALSDVNACFEIFKKNKQGE